MQQRIETLAELKAIRFDKKDTIFCKETKREYYFEADGGALIPDDLDYVQAVHDVDARFVAMDGSTSTGVFMSYKGVWDADTNTPALADGIGETGWVRRVTVSGSQNLGSGSLDFEVDDRVIYNGTTWEKWDANDAVQSVFGRTGAVTAQAGDYAAFYAALKTYITAQATPSRVTGSAPTALGQYRSYLRNAGARTYTETNGTPAAAPSSTNGYKLYNGNAFASADTNSEPSRYEIYIGTGKTPVFEFYSATGRTGFICTSIFPNWAGTNDVGCATGYDPATGIAFVTIIQNGNQCAPGLDEKGVPIIADIYFDIKC